MTLPGKPATPRGNSHPRGRAFWVAAGALFAVTPWATLGFGTPVAFAAAAAVFSLLRRAHARALWISAGIYAVALTARGVLAGSRSPNSTIDIFVLILLVGGGLQALLTVRAAATGQAARPAIPSQHAKRARLRDTERFLTGAILAVLAMAALTGGVLYLGWAYNFSAHHRITTGTVTDDSESTTCSPNYGCTTTFDVTVRYLAAGSKPVTFTNGGNPNPIPVGTHLPVYYVPGTSYASIHSPAQDHAAAIICILASWLVLLLLGLWMIIAAERLRRTSQLQSGMKIT